MAGLEHEEVMPLTVKGCLSLRLRAERALAAPQLVKAVLLLRLGFTINVLRRTQRSRLSPLWLFLRGGTGVGTPPRTKSATASSILDGPE